MRSVALSSLALSALLALSGCSTAPRTAADKATLDADALASVEAFKQANSSLDASLKAAPGYAVYPCMGKGAWFLGIAYGRGEVFEGGRKAGFCDAQQYTLGLQSGGRAYRQLIVFETPEALASFKGGRSAFSANAAIAIIKAAAGSQGDYAKGVSVYTLDEGGLAYDLSLGLQHFACTDAQ